MHNVYNWSHLRDPSTICFVYIHSGTPIPNINSENSGLPFAPTIELYEVCSSFVRSFTRSLARFTHPCMCIQTVNTLFNWHIQAKRSWTLLSLVLNLYVFWLLLLLLLSLLLLLLTVVYIIIHSLFLSFVRFYWISLNYIIFMPYSFICGVLLDCMVLFCFPFSFSVFRVVTRLFLSALIRNKTVEMGKKPHRYTRQMCVCEREKENEWVNKSVKLMCIQIYVFVLEIEYVRMPKTTIIYVSVIQYDSKAKETGR